MRSAAVRMSRAPARTSQRPATNVAGTRMLRSETRPCSEVRSARWKYQSKGVVRNSVIAVAVISGSRTGSMKPLWLSRSTARRPIGSRRAMGVRAHPACLAARAALIVRVRATTCGRCSGPSIVAKVSPGTPATAKRPETRSGWRKASSNIVLTPIDQPMSTALATPKWSITDSPSSTNSSIPQRSGSSGRWEPPVPRWFQETTRTSQAGSSSAGQVHGLVPRPLQSTTVGPGLVPSGSLVHARRRVPSSESTSWKVTEEVVTARSAEVGMPRLCPRPSRGGGAAQPWAV